MQIARRILAVLLVMALGLGTPVLSAQAGEMVQFTVEAAADEPTPNDCGMCGDADMAMPPSSCLTLCTGMQATAPRSAAALEVTAADFAWRPQQQFRNLTSAPDPFPPKLNILA